MKKLATFLLVALSAVLSAQTHRITTVDLYTGDPTGVACIVPNKVVQSTTTGLFYSCVSGHYANGTLFNGGTVTNPIVLPADPTLALQAATKQYVDSHSSTFNGGTVTNPIVLPADPTTALQASTKQYVDNHLPANSANFYAANAQTQVDSVVQSVANGMQAFGDSITAGQGTAGNGYVATIGVDLGITPTNNGVAADNVGDETWHMVTSLNPTDSGNPIVTSMIGTNGGGSMTSAEYSRQWLAGHAWGALSTSNKILAAATTIGGTTSTDSTFSNANGKTCSSGPCTFTYAASVGTPSVFYVWYKLVSSGANLSVTVDGSAATDTVTGSSTVSTSWVTAPVHQTATVGLARFAASNTGTAASHTIVVTVQTGGTFIGLGFPPVKRYRGVSHPRVVAAGVPPQQNNANASTVATANGYNLAGSKTLVGDGLDTPFVDVNSIDPVLDMSGSTAQNCTASTNPGLHPNNCGHLHIAQLFESVIGAVPPVGSGTIAGPITVTHASAPATAASFDVITPHNFNDTLIHKLNLGSGMFAGIGQYKNPTGGNFGMGVYADGTHEVGLGFSNNANTSLVTAESNFSWPFTLTPSLLQVFFSSEFFKFSSSGLCWGASGCTPIAASSTIPQFGNGSAVVCSAASCSVTLTASTTYTRVVLQTNVTTFTLSWPAAAGVPLTLDICQDGTGGRTLATPTAGATIDGWPSALFAASTAPSTCVKVVGQFEAAVGIHFGPLSSFPRYSVSWTPVAATVSSCVAQTVTVTGLATSLPLVVSPPSALSSHIWVGSAFVSSANTASVAFCADATGATPPSGNWLFAQ